MCAMATTSSTRERPPSVNLVRFAWLSLATSVAVLSLKLGAWLVTGSVGLLSDAMESTVNLVAAAVALGALRTAARPPDAIHQFGHGKAEYFSALVEGLMIVLAAGLIILAAVERLINPAPLESLGIGLGISLVASVLNGTVAVILIRAGRKHRSIALTADGKHLMTDVWTSAGVLLGVGLVGLTGWGVLDPVVAIAVAMNIIVTGVGLMRQSTSGLMDAALPAQDHRAITDALDSFTSPEVQFHALQTRQAGRQRFVSFHVLVPGDWTVKQGHDLLEEVEDVVHEQLPDVNIQTHLEPLEDPLSYTQDRGDHHPSPEAQHRW
jgi:cation diffusion facilitator family transporter